MHNSTFVIYGTHEQTPQTKRIHGYYAIYIPCGDGYAQAYNYHLYMHMCLNISFLHIKPDINQRSCF